MPNGNRAHERHISVKRETFARLLAAARARGVPIHRLIEEMLAQAERERDEEINGYVIEYHTLHS